MFDSPLIEVAIGLSFVFLLLSLLVSSVCELLAGFFRWRSQYLWAGLETLLQSSEARSRLYSHPLIQGLAPMKVMPRPISSWLGSLGLIPGAGPSYIPSRTFALAVMDVIREPHVVAASVEARINAMIDAGSRNPSAVAPSLAQLLRDTGSDPALASLKPRLDQLRARLFPSIDPDVLGVLSAEVEQVVGGLPTGTQASVAPVFEWLKQAPRARNYVELRAALADAIAAMPMTTPGARECHTTLEGILARFSHGSPDEIVRELKQFVANSKEFRHALDQASESMKGLAGSLGPLFEASAGDVDRFRSNVESWFDAGMDRVSGAYKRHTLAWQAAIGLVLALAMNIDALQIARSLWRDPALRQVLTAQAEAAANSAERQIEGSAEQRFNELRGQIGSLGLPLGWRRCETTDVDGGGPLSANLAPPLIWCAQGGWSWLGLLPMVLGWCLTAAAVSLGAPFWFDTLKRFVSIRSSGKAPDDARPAAQRSLPN